jgi:hypothetical protein
MTEAKIDAEKGPPSGSHRPPPHTSRTAWRYGTSRILQWRCSISIPLSLPKIPGPGVGGSLNLKWKGWTSQLKICLRGKGDHCN